MRPGSKPERLESRAKANASKSRLRALEALSKAGIEPDGDGRNWLRMLQGAVDVQGEPEPFQVRMREPGTERPPSIDPRIEGQAQIVIDWFESSNPREKTLSMAARSLSSWIERAKEQEPKEAGGFAKTARKLAQGGLGLAELEESLSAAHGQWSANCRIRRQAGELEAKLSLNAYPEIFPLARSLRREVEIFTGPTNSGKTYACMELLARARSGVYLAPLRLLAIEGQEAMQARGLPCSLVTGEERKIVEGAGFVASTVEMADFNRVVEVAVVDEAQMLADKDRGWAWTAAICGLPAKKLAIVCAPEAVGLIQALLARTGEPCSVKSYQRKNPLEPIAKPMSLDQVEKGDALIAFSRKSALMWREKVAARGKSVAVIYGSLAPEVRRGEAKRFADGSADVLVATDAIGMGLNLPIKRVIFTTASKFDGEETRLLSTQEVRQIAGRAGRFGMSEKGSAGAMERADCQWIAQALGSGVEPLVEKASVSPNERQVEQMGRAMGTASLGPILCFFRDHLVKSDRLFTASSMEDMVELAWLADRRIGLDLGVRFAYAKAPIDRNDADHVKAWEGWMRVHERGGSVKAPTEPAEPKSPSQEAKLWELERAMKLLSTYCWLSWRFERVFHQRAEAEKARAVLSEKIEAMLSRESSGRRSEKSAGDGRSKRARRGFAGKNRS